MNAYTDAPAWYKWATPQERLRELQLCGMADDVSRERKLLRDRCYQRARRADTKERGT